MPSVWIETSRAKRGRNHIVRWEFTPRDERGKPVRTAAGRAARIRGSESCGPSKEYAQGRVKEILEDLYAGRPIRPRVKFKTVPEIAQEFLKNSAATKAGNTVANFERPAVESFAAWFGRKPPTMIDAEALREWRDALLAQGYKANTVRMRLRDLSTFLGYAAGAGYLQANPFDAVKRKDLFPQKEEASRYLSDAEVAQLLPAMRLPAARAFYFILQTGLRHGELLNLDWKMIHRPAAGLWTMEITRASAHGIRSGHKVKTRRSRIVEIPDDARTPDVLGEPKTAGPVFDWTTRDVIESSLRAAAAALQLGRVRVHDARHTWATDFMYRTGNVFELMYRGGWRSMASADEYQHLRKRDEPDKRRPFSQYFPRSREQRGAA